jgi:hypothetical protein
MSYEAGLWRICAVHAQLMTSLESKVAGRKSPLPDPKNGFDIAATAPTTFALTEFGFDSKDL